VFNSRITVLGAGILLIIGACSSPEQPEQPSSMLQEQTSALQTATSQPAETTSGMAASNEDMAETKSKPAASGENMAAQEEQMKSYPQLSMGPNMARVTASIVDVEKTENSYICTLNIEQILGTGPSTPPLVRGNEIKVWIKKIVDHSEKLAGKEGTVEVTLQHAPPLASIQPPPPAWNVLEVH
jgi:hypothetical protein